MTSNLYELMIYADRLDNYKPKHKRRWALNCEKHIKQHPEW